MNISTIRDGLKVRLETISGLRGKVYTVIPTTVNAPCAIIGVGGGQRGDWTDGWEIEFGVLLLVARTDTKAAQAKLDDWISTDTDLSVIDAIEGDDNLTTIDGATVDTVAVTGWDSPASFTIGGTDYYGVQFNVEVAV